MFCTIGHPRELALFVQPARGQSTSAPKLALFRTKGSPGKLGLFVPPAPWPPAAGPRSGRKIGFVLPGRMVGQSTITPSLPGTCRFLLSGGIGFVSHNCPRPSGGKLGLSGAIGPGRPACRAEIGFVLRESARRRHGGRGAKARPCTGRSVRLSLYAETVTSCCCDKKDNKAGAGSAAQHVIPAGAG